MTSILIKVKYGETLRRLNVSVSESKLVLDIVMLKEKIRRFFNFGSDVEFTMTYVDEDGDTVTLADDDDLDDVVRQWLNPLRITVNLNSSNLNGPSVNSTSLRSPFQIRNNVPASILAKVLLALASSKASFSDPVIVKLVKKLKDAYPDVVPVIGRLPNVSSELSVGVNPESGGLNLQKKEKAPVGSTKSGGEGSTGKEKKTTDSVETKKDYSSEKKDDIGGSMNEFQKNQVRNPIRKLAMPKFPPEQIARIAGQRGLLFHDNNKITNDCSSSSQGMLHAANQSQFSGMPLTSPHTPLWKRDYSNDNNGMGSISNRGVVCCDGCGVHPITGPRFKSKVKDDYDLCNSCFTRMGNATDYFRMDHTLNGPTHHHFPSKGFFDHFPLEMQPFGSTPSKSKLDSLFILDVNVPDGTIVAPSTAFTKIWRMRNSGSVIWPWGSRLQWSGGVRLSGSEDFADVQLPMHGLPVGKEIDIAVDFTAPELPGQYVSYWMMTSPSGKKFGQRVWISIQVDASMKNSGETSINLNLPPVTNDPEVVNQDDLADNGGVSTTMATLSAPSGTATSSAFSYTEVGIALGSLPAGPKVTEPISYPIVDSSAMPPIISTGAALPPEVVVPPLDSSDMQPLPTLVAPTSGSGGGVISNDQEPALEEMGFKQKDLNKEISRMNSYDMRKTVDGFCGDSEWDPMLDELQEMGFTDDEANKRLLKKNNGSIKRVVMDLINGKKA